MPYEFPQAIARKKMNPGSLNGNDLQREVVDIKAELKWTQVCGEVLRYMADKMADPTPETPESEEMVQTPRSGTTRKKKKSEKWCVLLLSFAIFNPGGMRGLGSGVNGGSEVS